jgi:hypothetical protein
VLAGPHPYLLIYTSFILHSSDDIIYNLGLAVRGVAFQLGSELVMLAEEGVQDGAGLSFLGRFLQFLWLAGCGLHLEDFDGVGVGVVDLVEGLVHLRLVLLLEAEDGVQGLVGVLD